MRTLTQRTAGEFFITFAVFLFRFGRFRGAFGRLHTEQPAALSQLVAPMAVPQKAVVADAMKAVGHDMHQKAPDEFSGGQGHGFDLVAIPVVLPFELNLISFYIEQAVVGDSHAMGVAAHVVENLLWPGKRLFGIDHPVASFHPG